MDRKIDKKQLRKEHATRATKIVGALAIATIAFIIIGNKLRPAIHLSDINISTVSRGDVEVTTTTSGKVVPAFEEVLNSPISSRIIDVYKHSGDSVVKGEPILKLDLESVEVELKALQDEMSMKKLQFEQLKLTGKSRISELVLNLEIETVQQMQLREQLENQRYLDSLGSGTPSTVKKSEIEAELGEKKLKYKESELENQRDLIKSDEKIKALEIEILQRTLEQKRKQLAQAQILSPRSSILSFVNSQIGEQVAAGTKIATLTDVSEFKIEGSISTNSSHKVNIGGEVLAVIDKIRLRGYVSNLNPIAVDNTITFTVQLEDSKNRALKAGINCDIYIIESRESNKLRISSYSNYVGKGLYDMFVLEDDKLTKRQVSLSNSNFEYVVVEKGLEEGDKVVVSDLGNMKSNKEIKIKKQ